MTSERMKEISEEFGELHPDEMEAEDQIKYAAIIFDFAEKMEPFVKKYVESKKQVTAEDLDYLIRKTLSSRDY